MVLIDVISRYDVQQFDGAKYLVLAAESVDGIAGWLPSTSVHASLTFLIPGVVAFVGGLFVLLVKRTPLGRKPGEASRCCQGEN